MLPWSFLAAFQGPRRSEAPGARRSRPPPLERVEAPDRGCEACPSPAERVGRGVRGHHRSMALRNRRDRLSFEGFGNRAVAVTEVKAASRDVAPFLEALGSDVAAGLGSPLPPRRSGALGVFRHLLVSPLLARRARPLPRTWAHLQRPVPETAPFTRSSKATDTVAPPLEFLARPALGEERVGLEVEGPTLRRLPLSAFFTPSGGCSSLDRAFVFRRLALIGFSTLQSLCPFEAPAATRRRASPPRRFTSRSPRLPVGSVDATPSRV